jgi:hypothetical protein
MRVTVTEVPDTTVVFSPKFGPIPRLIAGEILVIVKFSGVELEDALKLTSPEKLAATVCTPAENPVSDTHSAIPARLRASGPELEFPAAAVSVKFTVPVGTPSVVPGAALTPRGCASIAI